MLFSFNAIVKQAMKLVLTGYGENSVKNSKRSPVLHTVIWHTAIHTFSTLPDIKIKVNPFEDFNKRADSFIIPAGNIIILFMHYIFKH